MTRPLYIVGAGGFAREVAWLVREINAVTPTWELRAFVDTARGSAPLAGLPVIAETDLFAAREAPHCVIAIGDPAIRRAVAARLTSSGNRFPVLVHPAVRMDRDSVHLGAGSIVCAGATLTVDITVGAHVQFHVDSTCGHDSVVGDFVTVAPGAHIAGRVRVGAGTFVGTGACVLQGLTVGEGTVIGGAALVNRDVPAGETVIGVPARPRTAAR